MEKRDILYFDCASGISGDMTLAALLDLGADEKEFLAQLAKLGVEGYEIKISETEKNGIRAKHVDVIVAENDGCAEAHCAETHGEDVHHAEAHGGDAHHVEMHCGEAHCNDAHHAEMHGGEPHHEHPHPEKEHSAHHHHGHPHRNFADIRKIIERSGLDEEVKALALRIFGRVAAAEAKVHGKTIDEVHFHEVGAVDSIVDVVGCAILINMLAPGQVYASIVSEGCGTVKCQHGILPVPVPATSEIFAAAGGVMKQTEIRGELVTPTGAAIICELAEAFGPMPAMKIEKIGWGAGTKDLPATANVLKVYRGNPVRETAYAAEEKTYPAQTTAYAAAEKTHPAQTTAYAAEEKTHPGQTTAYVAEERPWMQTDEIMVLETNLDDCTGEMLGYAMEKLMAAGALDVSYQPVFMKKNRPAYRMTVLVKPEAAKQAEELIFKYTTTIGIRRHLESRSILKRESVWEKTSAGECRGKKIEAGGEVRVYPEYEDAVKLAEAKNVSLWEIYRSYGK